MKQLLTTITLLFFITSCCSKEVVISTKEPVRIIFDTDLGNDIDDVLALQMLFNYEQEGKAELLGITLCKANPATIAFTDGYCRFNRRGNIPIGYAYHGVTPENGTYLIPTLKALVDNKPLIQPVRTIDSKLPEGYKLLRQILAEQPDTSVVLIAVGALTNIGNLLISEADEFSPLTGCDLVAAKVRRVVTMAGLFSDEFDFPEYNVAGDLEASHHTFELCPVPLTTTGWEVGKRLLYPHKCILKDFGNPETHPLSVAYCFYSQMPYDRPMWDVTAVLEAIEPGKWFDRSSKGTIQIAKDGRSSFKVSEQGIQDYLIIPPKKTAIILQAIIDGTTGRTLKDKIQ